MGCSPSKDKEEQEARAREASVRAALGASQKPQLVGKKEKNREEKKKQREAEVAAARAEKERDRLAASSEPKVKEPQAMPGRRQPDPVESDGSDQEDVPASPKAPTGDGSSSMVRGRLLQQIADQKAEIAQVNEENQRLQSELWNLKDSFDREVQGKNRMGKLQETENAAYQDAADQYREKMEAAQVELQRLKKQLSDTFSASTLARLLPAPDKEAKVRQEQAELRKKARNTTDGVGAAFGEGPGVFSMFGSGPPKGARTSKGVDELVATIQEQNRENKELRKERDRLRRELDKWEKEHEERLLQQEQAKVLAIEAKEAQANDAATAEEHTPWYQFGSKANTSETPDAESDTTALQQEVVSLKKQLENAQSDLVIAQAQLSRAHKGGQLTSPSPEQEPHTPGWFGRLLGPGREDDIAEAIEDTSNAGGTLGGTPAAGTGDGHILRAQVEELSKDILRADSNVTDKVQELTATVTRQLQARAEACQMLEEQRAGALEQLAEMQIEYDKVNAQLSSVLKVRDTAAELSDVEQLQVQCDTQEARIEALETQVADVVSANKELFAQTSEAMEENSALSSKIEEVMAECSRHEDSLLDANESLKALQAGRDELQVALDDLANKSISEAVQATAHPEADEEYTSKVTALSDCLRILQSSKSVSDAEARTCSLWRTRCVEVQAQRDAAIEIAGAVAAAQGVEEAHKIIHDYFEE